MSWAHETRAGSQTSNSAAFSRPDDEYPQIEDDDVEPRHITQITPARISYREDDVGPVASKVGSLKIGGRRRLSDSRTSQKSSRQQSFGEDDLLDNEFAQAMHTLSVSSPRAMVATSTTNSHAHSLKRSATLSRHQHALSIDWEKHKNREHLRSVRQLIRSLFWAFEGAARNDSRQDEVQQSKAASLVLRFFNHPVYSYLSMGLTFYALFAPDLFASIGLVPADCLPLAAVNTAVFASFVLEVVLLCWVVPGYICSGQFPVDSFATLSILSECVGGSQVLNTNTSAAGRGSRLVRLASLGSRSSRVIRIMRIFRNAQLLKLMPKIQNLLGRQTAELAFQLWVKRMRRVLQYVDRSKTGHLDEEDTSFLHLALSAEFEKTQVDLKHKGMQPKAPTLDALSPGKRSSTLKSSLEIIDSFWNKSTRKARIAPATDVVSKAAAQGSFVQIVEKSFHSGVGQASYQQCVEDIGCMKDCCAIVESALKGLQLKVCVIVISMLVVTQFLLASTDQDSAYSQGLAQAELMAYDLQVGGIATCSYISTKYNQILASSSINLLFLLLNNKVFWNSTCQCCDPVSLYNASSVIDHTALAENALMATGLPPHELAVLFTAFGSGSAMAALDMHIYTRAAAVASAQHTLVILVLLMAYVIYFSHDVKLMSSSNILHPMWDLMDDMNALKSTETLAAQEELSADERNYLVLVHNTLVGRTFSCWQTKTVVAEEITRMRESFTKLIKALLSWSQYVPMALLRQLLNAGVEAKIGCASRELSIFFCDIQGFKDICLPKSPQEVLDLLSKVLSSIYEALEDNGGTMLEFIGDEVLAVFNAPIEVNDHEKNAVVAALAASHNTMNLPEKVRLQCSVHKATVLTGNIGSPTRMKYGVLGDGVNLAARLKALNSRYGTSLLVSSEVMKSDIVQDLIAGRTIGKLILKGRTTATHTYEVLGFKRDLPETVVEACRQYELGFELFCRRDFKAAKDRFEAARKIFIIQKAELSTQETSAVSLSMDLYEDRPSKLFIEACDRYIENPPDSDFDGSELLSKKAF